MENPTELRRLCAEKLSASAARAAELTAFVGLDGFVDEIIHVVDQRSDPQTYQRVPTIAQFARRLAAAAGRSTNLELVNQRTKLGGNGPIMADALASLGLKVTCLGALGYPDLHPVFKEFARRAEVHSIAEPGHTDALEFEDGKIMMGKTAHFNQINWENIQARFGRDRFAARFRTADFIGFVNWTMLPGMSELWEALLRELCPALSGPRRKLFFDLADPEKRPPADITRALELIVRFNAFFEVILGLNEKEAYEIAVVLGLKIGGRTADDLAALCLEIHRRLPLHTLVVHPVTYALAVGEDGVKRVAGPYVAQPVLTTGAGDHFNAGFCLGQLLGLPNEMCLLAGVASSGHYVRTGKSPGVADLVALLRDWPVKS